VPSLEGRYSGQNVLLVTVDTLRADRLGAYGYSRATSPRIDRLAERGILLEEAFAPRGMTWPSLASIMTSLRPASSGVRYNGQHLSEEIPTLAKQLQAKDYVTHAFVGNACTMTRQGFDTRTCRLPDTELTDLAIEALVSTVEDPNEDRPWFVWVHYMATHTPYEPPNEFDRFRDPDYTGTITGDRLELEQLMEERVAFSRADLEELNGLYDGEVLALDHEVGRLFAAVDELGEREETLVAFLSDHGEDLAEHHDYLFHACSVYDSSLRVPFIVALPDGAHANTRVEGVTEVLDLAPTLLSLLGVPPLPAAEGASLASRISHPDDAVEDRIAYSEYYDRDRELTIESLRSDRWRYVFNPARLTPQCLPVGDFYQVEQEELYDLVNDPGETENVVHKHREVVEQFRQLAKESARKALLGEGVEYDESLRDELEALGYL